MPEYLGFVRVERDTPTERIKTDGFNEPVAAIVGEEAGPFRSSAAALRRVAFDPKKLSRRDRKFISFLPKEAAIVGGFARGMYLGDMRDVGDIDLAVYISKEVVENSDWHKSLQEMESFLYDCGYKIGYTLRDYGGMVTIRFLDERCGPYPSPYGFGIPRWNCSPIKSKWFWRPKREVDVLASYSQDIMDFLKLFDISICQFAYLNGQLYATETALADLAQKQFHVLRDTYPERAKKYWRKGYSPVWDDLMMKVMRVGTFDEAFGKLAGKTA